MMLICVFDLGHLIGWKQNTTLLLAIMYRFRILIGSLASVSLGTLSSIVGGGLRELQQHGRYYLEEASAISILSQLF